MSENKEKQEVDLDSIWEFLHSIDKKIDTHLIEDEVYRPKMLELVSILEKSKGAVLVFKLLFYIGAPLAALVYWIRDHVKL